MDDNSPTVSVILPTYNRADILGDAVRSVLSQTYEDFELLIVDDASTDDTDDIVAAFDDPRIRYLKHDINRGASGARNTGIEAARGSYIAFQDSDDEWFPEKLEKQMTVFDKSSPEVGVVYTGIWRTVNGEKRYLPYPGVDPKDGDIQESIQRQNFIPVQVAVVRRECFEQVGTFDEETPPIDDWDLWLRISQQFEFRLVDEPLVSAAVREDSISRDREAIVASRERIVNKNQEVFSRSPLANQYFYIGHGAMKLNKVGKGRTYFTKAILTWPHPLYVLALLLSVVGSRTYDTAYSIWKDERDTVITG